MSLKLTNTLTGRAEEFRPLSGTVGIYTCGMTVQDRPHVGHMRAYVTSDVLRRYLEFSGYKVFAVQNVTDIDDKIIARSHEEKTDYQVIAQRYHQEYLDVAKTMNIKPPDVFPRASEHIQEMIELIERLVEKGVAYESGGDVYFEVAKFPNYGKLSKKKVEDLIAGHRVAPGELKRSPADFALWKAAKPDEPYWPSPWGNGRPGWHIECSAMAMHYLGETFDIHMGGEDTIFPHHENEIAQSEAATGKPFARFWIHNAHINLRGEKMSKSTKHFLAARDILEKYSPNVLRLYLLQAHYRSPLEFSFELLDAATSAWTRIEDFLKRAGAAETEPDLAPLRAAMDDDLNTPHVLGQVFDAVAAGDAARVRAYLLALNFAVPVVVRSDTLRKVGVKSSTRMAIGFSLSTRFEVFPSQLSDVLDARNRCENGGHKDVLALIDQALDEMGMIRTERGWERTDQKRPGDELQVTNRLLDARDLARQNKLYEIADILRAGFDKLGLIVEDTPQGTRLIRNEK
jgi:cysteinyl-tRNA synthetase